MNKFRFLFSLFVLLNFTSFAYTNNNFITTTAGDSCNLSIVGVTSTNPTDCGVQDGIITIIDTSGGLLEYSIDSGFTWQSSNTFLGLGGGNYHPRVRNANGACQVAGNMITLVSPVAPVIKRVRRTNPTDCGLADGKLKIIATGTGSLEYSIDAGFTWQSSKVFTGLDGGTYQIRVRNANGTCEVGRKRTLVSPVAPVIDSVTSSNPTDCGLADGILTVNTTGTGSLEYSIDNGFNWQSSNVFLGLSGGNYQPIVRNANGTCEVTSSTITLVGPVKPVINNIVKVNPTDCGLADGILTVNATGAGSLEYSIDAGFTWQSSNTFLGLNGGNYQPRVRNANGTCLVAGSMITLVSPVAPVIDSVTSTSPTDSSLTNGTISIAATGTDSLEYSIDNGFTWQSYGTFTGLSIGIYDIAVRNGNGTCWTAGDVIMFVDSSFVAPPPPLPSASNSTGFSTLSDFSIFPNPAQYTANIKLSFDNEEDVDIEIVNSQGQLLISEREEGVTEGVFAINVQSLTAGLYFVRIRSNNEVTVKKLMISK